MIQADRRTVLGLVPITSSSGGLSTTARIGDAGPGHPEEDAEDGDDHQREEEQDHLVVADEGAGELEGGVRQELVEGQSAAVLVEEAEGARDAQQQTDRRQHLQRRWPPPARPRAMSSIPSPMSGPRTRIGDERRDLPGELGPGDDVVEVQVPEEVRPPSRPSPDGRS